jgi:hypothetical protein
METNGLSLTWNVHPILQQHLAAVKEHVFTVLSSDETVVLALVVPFYRATVLWKRAFRKKTCRTLHWIDQPEAPSCQEVKIGVCEHKGAPASLTNDQPWTVSYRSHDLPADCIDAAP